MIKIVAIKARIVILSACIVADTDLTAVCSGMRQFIHRCIEQPMPRTQGRGMMLDFPKARGAFHQRVWSSGSLQVKNEHRIDDYRHFQMVISDLTGKIWTQWSNASRSR